jgi:hypothetical protein
LLFVSNYPNLIWAITELDIHDKELWNLSTQLCKKLTTHFTITHLNTIVKMLGQQQNIDKDLIEALH